MEKNKSGLSIIVVFALSLLILSCTGRKSQEPRHSGVEYYRHLQLTKTPYDIEKGIYPVTSEEVNDVNNYRFTYDDEGRLLSVEYQRNNVLLDYSALGSARITYTYYGNMQAKRYFNSRNEPVLIGGIYADEFALNSEGNRVSMMFYDSTGKMIDNDKGIHAWIWNKLPDGSISENRYSLKGEDAVLDSTLPFYELRFSYDDNGYLTRMAGYRDDAPYNCYAEGCSDKGVSYLTFGPDKNGNTGRIEIFNLNGEPSSLKEGWSKAISEYDKNGYVTMIRYFDENNTPGNGVFMFSEQFVYDGHGAVTEIRYLDNEGNAMNNPEGIALVRYEYDQAGNRTDTITLSRDDIPGN